MSAIAIPAAGPKNLDLQSGSARHRTKRVPAFRALLPVREMPAPDPVDQPAEVQDRHDSQSTSDLCGLISDLREFQYQRQSAMRMQFRLENNLRNQVERFLGWRLTLPEKERKRIAAVAQKTIEAVVKGMDVAVVGGPEAVGLVPFIAASLASIGPFKQLRHDHELSAIRLAKKLPVWQWVKKTPGLDATGLAIIVGEAGDLSRFSTPYKLRKYLGLAPPETYRKPTKDGGDALKIPRQTRSAIWTIGVAMIRVPGPYREIYLRKKASEVERDPSCKTGVNPKTGLLQVNKHTERRAQRVAEQALLFDLWVAWREWAAK